MEWSLLPNALGPFKINCASPPITSQLVLFLWQTVEIGPLGHVRVVEALQNFVRKCDAVTLGIHIHIVGAQQFHCRWNPFCIKDLYPLQFYINIHLGQDVLWATQQQWIVTACSCLAVYLVTFHQLLIFKYLTSWSTPSIYLFFNLPPPLLPPPGLLLINHLIASSSLKVCLKL